MINNTVLIFLITPLQTKMKVSCSKASYSFVEVNPTIHVNTGRGGSGSECEDIVSTSTV